MVGDELAKLALGVGSVGEDGRPLEVNLADQFLGNGDVSGIASGQHDRYGVAQSVYSGVNLRASAASTDANALIGLGFVYAISHLVAAVTPGEYVALTIKEPGDNATRVGKPRAYNHGSKYCGVDAVRILWPAPLARRIQSMTK